MLGHLSSASILGPSFILYLMVRSFSWQTPSERQMPGGFFFLPTLWRQNRSPRCGSRPASSENDGEAGVSIYQNMEAQAWLLYSVVSPEPSWSGSHTRVCRQKTLDVTLSELGAHVRSPPGDMRRVQRERCAGLFAQGELEQPTKEALESTAEDQSPIPALPHCT